MSRPQLMRPPALQTRTARTAGDPRSPRDRTWCRARPCSSGRARAAARPLARHCVARVREEEGVIRFSNGLFRKGRVEASLQLPAVPLRPACSTSALYLGSTTRRHYLPEPSCCPACHPPGSIVGGRTQGRSRPQVPNSRGHEFMVWRSTGQPAHVTPARGILYERQQ